MPYFNDTSTFSGNVSHLFSSLNSFSRPALHHVVIRTPLFTLGFQRNQLPLRSSAKSLSLAAQFLSFTLQYLSPLFSVFDTLRSVLIDTLREHWTVVPMPPSFLVLYFNFQNYSNPLNCHLTGRRSYGSGRGWPKEQSVVGRGLKVRASQRRVRAPTMLRL